VSFMFILLIELLLIVRFQVLMAASVKMTALWDTVLCSLLELD
jgi:hypothetical protein